MLKSSKRTRNASSDKIKPRKLTKKEREEIERLNREEEELRNYAEEYNKIKNYKLIVENVIEEESDTSN